MAPRLLISFMFGLLARVGWWAYARPVPVSDFEYYRRLGLELLVHHQLGYPRPSAVRVPGYPALLAALMLVSRSTDWLALANVALSALLILVVYRLARVLTGDERVARLAALVSALSPELVFLSPVLASEHLYVLLLFGSLLLLAPAMTTAAPSRARVILAGLCFGAATLTRPDGLFYLPVAAVLARSHAARWTLRYRPVLPFLLCVLIVVAPWYVRNLVSVGPGAGLSVQGGLTFYYGHNERGAGYHPLQGTPLDGLGDVERQRKGYEVGWKYISDSRPSQLWGDLMRATAVLFWGTGAGSLDWSTRAYGSTPDNSTAKPLRARPVLEEVERFGYRSLLVVALLAVVFARRYPRLWVAYGVVVMTWVCYAGVYLAMTRYRYAAEIAMCILAAVTVSECWRLASGGVSAGAPARR